MCICQWRFLRRIFWVLLTDGIIVKMVDKLVLEAIEVLSDRKIRPNFANIAKFMNYNHSTEKADIFAELNFLLRQVRKLIQVSFVCGKTMFRYVLVCAIYFWLRYPGIDRRSVLQECQKFQSRRQVESRSSRLSAETSD